jgi:DNA-binding transcriptional LysR family regulator
MFLEDQMKFKQLEYLIGVCNAGSISLAAEQLHVAQPSISQSISALEEELAVKIFNRSRQGVQLTEEGKLVLQKAYEILGNVESLKEELSSKSLTISGTLKLGIVPSVCSSFLPQVLANYKKKSPLVQLEIVEEGSLEVLNDVQTGSVEIGVLSIPKGEKFGDTSIQFHELTETEFKLQLASNSNPRQIK